jgi:methylated-DNA-[protein]-cysteine S-methyltransferase
MKPTHTALQRCQTPTPLGTMTLATDGAALVGVWFDGQKHLPDPQTWPLNPAHPVLLAAQAQLADYFAARLIEFDLPLGLASGTAFQQAVWRALLEIAPGATVSYGELARRIGKPQAVRAVGAAVGRNPLSIVVPCHRVVGSTGALTGYAGGLERKVALLALEQTARAQVAEPAQALGH